MTHPEHQAAHIRDPQALKDIELSHAAMINRSYGRAVLDHAPIVIEGAVDEKPERISQEHLVNLDAARERLNARNIRTSPMSPQEIAARAFYAAQAGTETVS